MPVQVTYPGVYIQEIPSGSHTISGVATSITAFMGRALRGPLGAVDGPVTIFSFQDYVNIFGGLSHDSPMSYAVNDFFLNGGGQAIIVRLFEQLETITPASPGDTYTAAFMVDAPTFTLTSPPFTFNPPFNSPTSLEGLQLQAANPGTWGNYLVAQVDVSTPTIAAKVLQMYAPYGVLPTDPLFNLTIYYNPPSGPLQSERFLNMTVTGGKNNPNRIDRVLQAQSMLVRAATDYDSGPGAGNLTQNWLNDWIDFNQAVASQNLNQKELLGILPGANSSGGTVVQGDSTTITSDSYASAGTKALDQVDLFNLLCVPPDFNDLPATQDSTAKATAAQLLPYCVKRRAVMILDPLNQWSNNVKQDQWNLIQPTDYNISGDEERNAAVYFPHVVEPDPLMKNQPITVAPCGIIAGVIAGTDLARGVWKAPAGIDAGVNNILQLELKMTDDQNGILNPLGINCLRTFPVIGTVVWGARTLRGADELEDDYKYLNVRRLTLYVEESLYRGTKWAVFEPNDSTLWGSLVTSIDAFLAGLQRQGAFYSYFVQCDATTTTPTDINLGIVNILVGIAPVKPAEFVVISIQQLALQPSS
jgi:phage tail sheath protein FI